MADDRRERLPEPENLFVPRRDDPAGGTSGGTSGGTTGAVLPRSRRERRLAEAGGMPAQTAQPAQPAQTSQPAGRPDPPTQPVPTPWWDGPAAGRPADGPRSMDELLAPWTTPRSHPFPDPADGGTGRDVRPGRDRGTARDERDERDVRDERDERDPGAPRERTRRRLPPLTLVLATLLLVAWALTCVVDASGYVRADELLVAAAAASPYAALFAVPVATVALRRRRWVTAALAVAAGVLPWVFVLGYAVEAEPAQRGPTATVRTMLVDAGTGTTDAAGIVAAVQAHAVDVLVVTRLSGTLAHDLTGFGLDAQLRPRWVAAPDGARPGTGVWSRFELQGATEVPGTAQPAVRARLETPGAGMTIVAGRAVQPVPGDVGRWRQDLAALGAAARVDGPVVVVGNLNATPWHSEFRRFMAGGLSDAADAHGRGLRSTWPSWSPVALLPLDHVLVGGGVGAQEVETLLLGGTDHRALLVTLEVPQSAGR